MIRIKDIFPKPDKRPPISSNGQPPRVVRDSTRQPVNLQAALIIRKAPEWARPLPPERPKQCEWDRLREELDVVKKNNIALRQEMTALRKKCQYFKSQSEQAQARMREIISEMKKKEQLETGSNKELLSKKIKRAEIFLRLSMITDGDDICDPKTKISELEQLGRGEN